MLTSSGTLHYDNRRQDFGHQKLVLSADQALSDLYRALCPKYLRLNPQRYPAHVSVVRKEIPPQMEYWNKYEGEEIEFFYQPYVHGGTIYYWLNIFCTRLEEIRAELGLEVSSSFTRPPDGFVKCFHLTLGNIKQIL